MTCPGLWRRGTVAVWLVLIAAGCGPSRDEITYMGKGLLDSGGGTLWLQDLTIEARPGALADAVHIEVAHVVLPAPLPDGLALAADPVDISVDDEGSIVRPLVISMRYDDSFVPDEESMLVFHHDPRVGYEAVTILAHDTEANVIRFESRIFSPFVITFDRDDPPANFDTGFDPGVHGWGIYNHSQDPYDRGHCWGMTSYAQWCFAHCSDGLFDKYDKPIALLTSMRAHMAQSQIKVYRQYKEASSLGPQRIGKVIKSYLARTGRPVAIESCKPEICHTVLVIGYTPNALQLYDVNFVGDTRSLAFDGNSFGRLPGYSGYREFGYIARPSLGRSEDFFDLTAQAEAGFRQADYIRIEQPAQGGSMPTVHADEIQVEGSILRGLNRKATLFMSSSSILTSERGTFGWTPVSKSYFGFGSSFEFQWTDLGEGVNRVVLMAGVDDLFDYQSTRTRNADTIILEINRAVSSETDCFDGVDNDADGLTDKEDPDCNQGCDAVPVRCGDVIEDTTVGGSHLFDEHPGCSDWDESGPERIYVLQDGPDSGVLNAKLAGLQEGVDLDVYVHENGCEFGSCKEQGDTSTWCVMDPGKQYYVIVDGYKGDAGSFTLEIQCE